ncbi:hypothetical protein SAMN06295974_3704 [Plantibacter flavus]|uniref:hypothetical protein n=1 Tax=Plantibacter flavus TaxID=150123 RepID=UPI000A0B2DFD|nr:hypothetical protein [Plantibacter flavus]SMG48256.1 hypothetical protein SAMN06295974_3704 [Plantibacter flavus]
MSEQTKDTEHKDPTPRWRKLDFWVLGVVLIAGVVGWLMVPYFGEQVELALSLRPETEDLSRAELNVLAPAQIFACFAVVGVMVAGVGAALQALTHGRPARSRTEYVGKLLVVAATVFTLVGVWGTLVPELQGLVSAGVITGAVALALFALIFGVVEQSRMK